MIIRYTSSLCTDEHVRICRGVIPRQSCSLPVESRILFSVRRWPDVMFIAVMRSAALPPRDMTGSRLICNLWIGSQLSRC
jgi:hypothetical protein